MRMMMTMTSGPDDDDADDDAAPFAIGSGWVVGWVVGNSVGNAVGLVLGDSVWWLQAPGTVSYSESISWRSVLYPVLQVRVS